MVATFSGLAAEHLVHQGGAKDLIRETLFVFALALLFAYLLWPLVHFLDRRLPGRSKVPALTIVYLSLVGLLIIIGIAIGSRVMLQANALAMRIPELLSRLEPPVQQVALPSLPAFKETVISTLQKQLVYHSQDLLSFLSNAVLNVLSNAGRLIYIVLVPILRIVYRQLKKKLLYSVSNSDQVREPY